MLSTLHSKSAKYNYGKENGIYQKHRLLHSFHRPYYIFFYIKCNLGFSCESCTSLDGLRVTGFREETARILKMLPLCTQSNLEYGRKIFDYDVWVDRRKSPRSNPVA